MTATRVVLVTGPDVDTLRTLARTLLDERLIACANLVDGVRSIFRWQGEVAEEGEALAILKTTEGCVATLRARVLELHPYEVPEFLSLSVSEGAEAYLDWVSRSVEGDG